MYTFVICLVVVGVAVVAVLRITFGDEDQPATTPKRRHRGPGADEVDEIDAHPPPALPAELVPAFDPTALADEAPLPAPAVGVADDDDDADASAATPATEPAVVVPSLDETAVIPPPDEPLAATTEITPERTAPLPEGAAAAAAAAAADDAPASYPGEASEADRPSAPTPSTSAAADGGTTISVPLPPNPPVNGTVPFPTPGPTELVPDFGAMALPWPDRRPVADDTPAPPATTPAPLDDTAAMAVPPDDTAAIAVPLDDTASLAALTDAPADRGVSVPDRGDATRQMGAAHAATTVEPYPPGQRYRPITVAPSYAEGNGATVMIVRPTNGRRFRSTVTLLLTVTLVGVLVALTIGVSAGALAYGLRELITG